MRELIVERDGGRIYGRIAFPSGEGPFPTVVFSHGFGASHVYDSDMHKGFVDRGMAFCSFDFCGGGPQSQSSGSMLDMSVLTEAADLHAVVDAVQRLRQVDGRRLFLIGGSQGGWVSTYVAADRPQDVAALVLFFPAFNIADDTRERIAACGGRIPETMQVGPHVVGPHYSMDVLAVDIFERAVAYPGDVLIVHGELDEMVPISYSRRAAATFGGPCRLETIEGMGHGFRNATQQQYAQALDHAYRFLAAKARRS